MVIRYAKGSRTKNVAAVPKERAGICAKPSTRDTITFAAMTVYPKLFVKDCTTSMIKR